MKDAWQMSGWGEAGAKTRAQQVELPTPMLPRSQPSPNRRLWVRCIWTPPRSRCARQWSRALVPDDLRPPPRCARPHPERCGKEPEPGQGQSSSA